MTVPATPPRMRIAGDNPFVDAVVAVGHQRVAPEAAELVFNPTQPVLPGQICAGYGCPLAEIVPFADGLAFSIIPLPGNSYGVQASDQLSMTIVELLAAEAGVGMVPVPPARYNELMLALSFTGFAGVLRQEARQTLQQVLGNDAVVQEIMDAAVLQPPLPIPDLERALSSIDAPGRARDFLALVEHSAAFFDQRDTEIWAATATSRSHE